MKNLLKDGGALERGYDIDDNEPLDFENPYHYVRALKECADKIFNEKYSFEEVVDAYEGMFSKGLFETIAEILMVN